MTASSAPKYVLYQQFFDTQEHIDIALSNHRQLRYYHSADVKTLAASIFVVFGDILASAVNATIIGKGHPEYKIGAFPMLVPYATLFSSAPGQDVGSYWKSYWTKVKENPESPLFFKHVSGDLNFVYCTDLKSQESIWNFFIFTKTFDHSSWLLLIILLLVLARLLKVYRTFWENLMITLEAILSPGVHGGSKKSTLLVLWLLTCTIIITFYSGDMTSHVISPSKEETIRNLEELEKKNYALFFGDMFTVFVVNSSVKDLIQRPSVNKNILYLDRLMERAKVDPDHQEKEGGEAMAKHLVNYAAQKVATVYLWTFALSTASLGNKYANEIYKLTRKFQKRKCHVGKELIKTAETFLAIVPPGSEQLGTAFGKLTASGILARWVTEVYGVGSSIRVQDRARIHSPTNVEDSGSAGPKESLALKEKTITIFMLWVTCIVMCLIGFGAEILIRCGTRSLKLQHPISNGKLVRVAQLHYTP